MTEKEFIEERKDSLESLSDDEDIILWKDRHDEVKRFKSAGKPWIHILVGRRKEDGKLVLRVIKPLNRLSLNSKEEFARVITLLGEGGEELGWNEGLDKKEIIESVDEIEELRKKDDKTSKELRKYKESVKKLTEQMVNLRNENFIAHLEDFRSSLSKFKNLLESGTEKEIQLHLYSNLWMFGPTYLEGTKEELTKSKDRIDFKLQRYDTFYDIIELKLPKHEIFNKGSKKKTSNVKTHEKVGRSYPMSAHVKNAISQVIGYIESKELSKKDDEWDSPGSSAHKPRGIVVMGRSLENEKRALQTLNSYLHDIEIKTYDHLFKMGENFIKLIEDRRDLLLKERSKHKNIKTKEIKNKHENNNIHNN